MSVNRHPGRVVVIVVGLVVLFACVAVKWWQVRVRDELQAAMRVAFAANRNAEVEQLAKRLQAAGRLRDNTLWMAAQAAAKDRRFSAAIAWFDLIPADSPRHLEALAATGEIYLLSLHQPSPAESRLRQTLKLNPEHVLARQQLAGLLGMTGRTSEASRERIHLIRQRQFTHIDLTLMGLRETALENAGHLADFDRDAPQDPLTHLARGHFDFVNHHLPAAEKHLRQVIRDRPDLIRAHALLGRLLLEMRRFTDLPAWRQVLPAAALDDAAIWTTLGDWESEAGHPQQALRCFLEAIHRDPLQQQACYQAAQILQTSGQNEAAERFRNQATQLQELLIAVKRFHSEQAPSTIKNIVECCEKLGLLWEAHRWTLTAGQSLRGQPWIAAAKARLEPKLSPDLGRVLPTANPTAGMDLKSYPLPEWKAAVSSMVAKVPPVVPAVTVTKADSHIAFRDDAQSAGLKFDYLTGHDPAFGGLRVFEFAGGGCGVLDHDLDGWPDLYFTQGCTWPPSTATTHLDRLFQNTGDGRLRDITLSSRLVENRYSHGVAVGDWNDDGFPDLYIGNAGPNRLFLNQGDGTFTDVTESTGIAGNQWTTSCLIADLNGDGWPDLYAANYLAGDNMYERLCAASGGRKRACTPHDLDAAPDEFHLNLGDGRFSEQTAASGFLTKSGKSFGLVAADFNGSGRLGLFVSNDTDGNLFFENVGKQNECKFEEQAVPLGLAFDREGRSLACMGIAAGDANDDGRLDLFVTNYFRESNTLYVQQPTGGFQDETIEAGLRTPSLEVLGFGTQFLDADLDGHSDLVVVNGHVDVDLGPGVPYQMLPQFFRNAGGGRFVELHSKQVGPWFARPTLGRGLATLDWNRDGRVDFVVSHLEHPASLMTNVSSKIGNSLAVRLHGTTGNRDAIGAVLRLETDTGTLVRQIAAGDGYLASNERVVIFGMGAQSQGNRLIVQWPGGKRQVVERPLAGREYRLIEGRSTSFVSPFSGG